MNTSSNFGKDSIWSLIAKNGIPSMLTMVIVIIYNLADTFFVGQTHKKNLGIVFHTGIHAFILLILGYIATSVYEYRGYWLMVSGLAVLIGDEYGKIITRGLKRILGALIGFFHSCLLNISWEVRALDCRLFWEMP